MILSAQQIHSGVSQQYPSSLFSMEVAAKVNEYHRSFSEYGATPLADLRCLAKELGVKSIRVKDERWRFGLNAFKVLGGSYAIGNYIAGRMDVDISELPFDRLVSDEVRGKLGDITFVTATDGNHGRGVAWTAARLGQKSVVYMPKGTAPERLENIRKLGSDASILDLYYDDCVRKASEGVDKYGWVLIQDTSWPGYEQVPLHIMQGYTTMGYEMVSQMQGERPTHIFLQAGVGSMAAAIAAFYSDLYKGVLKPVITIVEPTKADCFYKSVAAGDGQMHSVGGPLDSIMAGLSCGEPCSIAWDILKACGDFFISMDDYVAAQGMRVLANPIDDDPRIISGESGASTMGFVTELLRREEFAELRRNICLDSDSVILCISTEGATDRANYRRVVWDGAYTR